MTEPTTNAAPSGTVGADVVADAELDGRSAARHGQKVGDNPFPDTDERHWRWMLGWVKVHEANRTRQNESMKRGG